jgi:predicted DNA-binding protein with PD1-like motif
MQAEQGTLGRVFVLRLEDGDRIPECIEAFAQEQGVQGGVCYLVGGIGGGALVVGPEDGKAAKIKGIVLPIHDAHEVAAVGTLFPDSTGAPRLHMHAALGRGESPLVGCVRPGVEVWKLGEAVLIEINDSGMTRKLDPSLGVEVLSA